MFDLYAKKIGQEIQNMLLKCNCRIDHVEKYYNFFEVKTDNIKSDVISQMIKLPFFVVDLEYHFISSYEVNRYFTKNQSGKMSFWEYDYKKCFPVRCRPRIIINSLNGELLAKAEEIICDNLKNGITFYVNHPILTDECVYFKLSTGDNIRIVHSSEEGERLISTIYFDTVTLPWFDGNVSIEHVVQDKNLQSYIIKQIIALFNLSDNCRRYYKSISQQDSKLLLHTKERIISINSNRRDLLELLDIPTDMWTLKYIEKIEEQTNRENSDLKNAINNVREEIRKESKQKASFNKDSTFQEDPDDDYGTYDEGCFYGPQTESNFVSNTVSSYIANRSIAKEVRKQTEQMERMEREQQKREIEERMRRAYESRRQYEATIKANQERRRKGQPELPLPPVDWY